MTIQELFIGSNEMEEKVVAQIGESQWGLMMPQKITREPMTVAEVVRFHIWDDAWIPDGLAGKTLEEIGDVHGHLLNLTNGELRENFTAYTLAAIDAVRNLNDLGRMVHLSYGDFPAGAYLQHNVSVRAFWSYDIAKLISADTSMGDDFVQALLDEFSPVAEDYRQLGLFPPAIKVASGAGAQARLLAMVGRE